MLSDPIDTCVFTVPGMMARFCCQDSRKMFLIDNTDGQRRNDDRKWRCGDEWTHKPPLHRKTAECTPEDRRRSASG